MFQRRNQSGYQQRLGMNIFVDSPYKIIFVTVFQFSFPKRIKLMVRGWKTLTVSLNTLFNQTILYSDISNGWHPLSYHTNHIEGYQKRPSLRLLHLFISPACNTAGYLFPIIK